MKTKLLLILSLITICQSISYAQKTKTPNVILIYADDLGYGDLSCYGATKLKTPNIDKLAQKGIKFLNGHSTAATCTPSRYSLMTGRYAWREKGTNVLPGDAAMIVPTDRISLPKVFKKAGYQTAIVGKWHLGLGNQTTKNWNDKISPSPNEVGFDYSFIFPATADRVPTVFIENHEVVGLEKHDTIKVNYAKKIGNEPTGKQNPELLKMAASPNQGHDQTIVNGIGRIGFMEGGKSARWVDEEVSYTFLNKAQEFIENNYKQPFFLFFSLTEPHVPRMPATMFKGKSGLGYRGDAILQIDWTVGKVLEQLKSLGIEQNTIIIFTSDNGPVLDDGYQDGAVTQLNGHTPAGKLRGGKYSIFEAGTRVPFIIKMPNWQKPKVSNALVSQIDFLASFSALFNQQLPDNQPLDSENILSALLGKSDNGRKVYVEQSAALAIIQGNWKYIQPNNREPYLKHVDIESGNSPKPQLYNLKDDISERNNLADKFPEKVNELEKLLEEIKKK